MTKKNTTFSPSLEEFCRYIERKGYDLDPILLFREFESRDWTTAKGVRTKSWTALVDARNSVACQKRRNDEAVLLGMPTLRKNESKQSYQHRLKKAKTKVVKTNYNKFLQDPRWLAFRQFVLDIRGFRCEDCGSTDRLQVHHLTYKTGLFPWEYTCNEVKVLCRKCHAKVHGIIDDNNEQKR